MKKRMKQIEKYKKYFRVNILAPYDLSVRLREEHDFRMDKKYNRMSEQKRRELYMKKKYLKKIRSVQPQEKIINPWME